MEKVYDGFVSRHLNRRISRPIARLLSHTPATPNQVSMAGLGIALASFFSFVYGSHIAGAILVQASSVVDGVDGDLARLKGMGSGFGGFMDSMLDRYADTLIILGVTLWAASESSEVHVWLLGFWALAGSFGVTYSRASIERVKANVFDSGITSAASRDVRLLVVMVGGLAGQSLGILIALVCLTNAVVLLRLLYARRVLGGT